MATVKTDYGSDWTFDIGDEEFQKESPEIFKVKAKEMERAINLICDVSAIHRSIITKRREDQERILSRMKKKCHHTNFLVVCSDGPGERYKQKKTRNNPGKQEKRKLPK
jgi:ribosomal protein L33